jgi:hypothetical protein
MIGRTRTTTTGALVLALALLAGCAPQDEPRDASHLTRGSAYSSGSSDDGRFFYRTSVAVSRGKVRVSAIRWIADSGSPPAAINFTPGAFEGGDGNGAVYQSGDNLDALPITLSADRTPTAVVTVVFVSPQQPDGHLELVDDSGEILQITPNWE